MPVGCKRRAAHADFCINLLNHAIHAKQRLNIATLSDTMRNLFLVAKYNANEYAAILF